MAPMVPYATGGEAFRCCGHSRRRAGARRCCRERGIGDIAGSPNAASASPDEANAAFAAQWFDPDLGLGFSVAFPNPGPEGIDNLADVYARHQQPVSEFAVFEPTKVLGYPAVLTSTVAWSFEDGCEMYLGVNEKVALDVGCSAQPVTGPAEPRNDPCPVMFRIAESVVRTLQAAR